MSVDQALSILGIAIGVLFGVVGLVWGAKVLNKNNKTQSQRVSGKDNFSVQAGRDANVENKK